MVTLLSGATATGDWVPWTGGTGLLEIEASNWNGATASFEFQSAQGTAIAVEDADGAVTFTDDGSVLFRLPNGTSIRIAISVATPTGVDATAINVGE